MRNRTMDYRYQPANRNQPTWKPSAWGSITLGSSCHWGWQKQEGGGLPSSIAHPLFGPGAGGSDKRVEGSLDSRCQFHGVNSIPMGTWFSLTMDMVSKVVLKMTSEGLGVYPRLSQNRESKVSLATPARKSMHDILYEQHDVNDPSSSHKCWTCLNHFALCTPEDSNRSNCMQWGAPGPPMPLSLMWSKRYDVQLVLRTSWWVASWFYFMGSNLMGLRYKQEPSMGNVLTKCW